MSHWGNWVSPNGKAGGSLVVRLPVLLKTAKRRNTVRVGLIMKVFPALVGIAALVATPAHAEENSGFYLAADGGITRADTRKNDFDQVLVDLVNELGIPVTEAQSSLDDRDTTYGITAGYRFDSWLAVEASYLDLGEVNYQVDGEVSGVGPASLGLSLDTAGLALSALVIGDMGKFDPFARIGIFYADIEGTANVSAGGESASESLSNSSEEFFWGLGANYQFADRWSARIEYRNFDKVGDSSSPVTADVNTLNLGVVYTFGRE